MKYLWTISLFILLVSQSVFADTIVNGIINTDTTWSISGSPYRVTSTVQIEDGTTLAIDPGVTITNYADDSDMFLIHGTLYAHGSIDNPITFDGEGRNGDIFTTWGGAGFASLDYCQIRNGKHLWNRGGYFELRHSVVENLSSRIQLESPSGDTYIEHNRFIDSGGIGVYQAAGRICTTFIRNNLFVNPLSSIHNFGGSPGQNEMIVKYNSFTDISGLMLSIAQDFTSAVIDGRENYWDTTDTSIIDSMIYDLNDDIRCQNYIEYLPILNEPHEDTPIYADFTASSASGFYPLNVSFSNLSIGIITSCLWNFGDGTTSSLVNPIHIYTNSGVYTVTLNVTGPSGSVTETKTDYISVVLPTYTLSASVSSGNGTLSPHSGIYDQGTVVNLTATPESGYRIKEWHGTDNDTSTAITNTVTMNSNRIVTVEFEQIIAPTYNLSTSVTGSGTITLNPSGGSYTSGTSVIATARPSTGWKFVQWEIDASGTNPSVTINMTSNKNIRAVFEEIIGPLNKYVLEILIEGQGTVNVDPISDDNKYTVGSVVEITASPSQDWVFMRWEGNVDDTSSLMTAVTMNQAQSIKAVFSQKAIPDEDGGGGGGGCLITSTSPMVSSMQVLFTLLLAGIWSMTLRRK